jgi:hypothetical protein
VAAFGARGITEGIVEAAKEDYRECLRLFRSRQGRTPSSGSTALETRQQSYLADPEKAHPSCWCTVRLRTTAGGSRIPSSTLTIL